MIKDINKIFILVGLMFLGLVVWSCESSADELGTQFFQNGTAQGNETHYPIIAYNISNKDSIRTDKSRLDSLATLGAFSESVFGMQKSSYVTQLRLPSYSADFGTNPTVDSVVLAIKPLYAADSVVTTTNSSYSYPDGNVDSKKIVSTYPVYKYGKAKKSFNLQVYEVADFLGSYSDQIYSNKDVSVGSLLGSKIFAGTINSIQITKNSDNTSLWSSNGISVRIPLDANFFQNKLIAQQSTGQLADVATFIRYFKGLKITVAENDGYIFRFLPSDISLIMYYKNDVTASGTTTRTQNTYTFDLSPSYNAHFNQIQYNRSGSTVSTAVTAIQNTATGDAKLYAQGMGGPGFGIKIPDATIQNLKSLYTQNKIGIISAKIRLYTDASTWDNAYKKPWSFVVREKEIGSGGDTDLYTYLTDMIDLSGTGYALCRHFNYSQNSAYYDISITKTFKNIIESGAVNRYFIMDVGSYTYTSSGYLTGLLYGTSYKNSQYFNTRSYTPNRAVLVGTDPAIANNNYSQLVNANSAQLVVTYGQK